MLNAVKHRLAFAFLYPKELIELVIPLPKWRGKERTLIYRRSQAGQGLASAVRWRLLGAGAAGGRGGILAPSLNNRKTRQDLGRVFQMRVMIIDLPWGDEVIRQVSYFK
jgi:hypothetical protein